MKLDKKINFAVRLSITNANPNGGLINGNRPRTDYEGFGVGMWYPVLRDYDGAIPATNRCC